MQQVTNGRPVTPEIQKTFDKSRAEVAGMMKEFMNWENWSRCICGFIESPSSNGKWTE